MCISSATKIWSLYLNGFQYKYPAWVTNNFNTVFLFSFQFPLYCQQFRSMFIKRVLFSWRNWKLVLLQILVTLAVTTYLLLDQTLKSDMPARDMDLSQYGRTIVPYSVSGNSDLALKLIKNLNIFLKLQNQELRKVQGKTYRKERDCCYMHTYFITCKEGT